MKKINLFIFMLLAFTVLNIVPNTIEAQIFTADNVGINSANEECVDITAYDFHDILAMQFSMHYDETLLEFTGFSNLSTSLGVTTNDFSVFDGSIGFLWLDPSLAGVTLEDHEVMFSLCFTAVTAQNAVSPIAFDGTPTAIEVVDTNDQILTPNFNDGSVTITSMDNALAVLGGALDNEFCGNNMGSISPYIVGGVAPLTYVWTGPNGFTSTAVNITSLAAGTYEITVEDTDGVEVSASFIVEDEALAVLNATVTASGCGGATGSISVATNGMPTFEWNTGATTASISDLASGTYTVTITEGSCALIETYTVEEELLLAASINCLIPISVDASAVVWNGTAPFTFDWSTGFSETVDSSNPDIPAVSTLTLPFGIYTVTVTDATGCTNAIEIDGTCDDNSGDVFFTVSPEDTYLEVGESTCIDITTANFTAILGMQFTVEWDETLLQFESINNFNVPGLIANDFNTGIDGKLLLSWIDQSGLGSTLADGDVMFSICLKAVAEGSSSIQITDDPVLIEVVGSEGLLDVSTNNGLAIIGDTPVGGAPSLYGSSESGIAGEIVCVDVNVTNMIDVVAMQFSVNWDADALNFLGIEDFYFGNANLIAQSFSSFEDAAETGELRFAFLDSSPDSYTFLSDTKLFEVCFEVTGAFGTYPVSITDTPIPIEIVDENSALIPVVASAGEVVVEEAVWPGDADQNGVVNQYDLLNIGLAYGTTGAARSTQNINWTAFYIENWGQNTPTSNVDYKHIDTDGDGMVNADDQLALEQNWGESTDFWDGDEPDFFGPIIDNTTNEAVPFYIVPDTLVEGQTAMLDIILGEESLPADNIYGVAFTIAYDAALIVPTSVHAHFDNSWLGDVDENMLSIYREDAAAGKLHVAITRTDGLNVSGSGAIGQMEITILDVIFRDELVALGFEVEDVKLISYDEEDIPVQAMLTTSIIDVTTGVNNPALAAKITVFPTPTSNIITILSKEVQIQKIELLQIDGKHLQSFENQTTISLKNRNQGNYLLKIITEEGVIVKRIMKI